MEDFRPNSPLLPGFSKPRNTLTTTLPWLTPSSWRRGSTPWPPLCPGWPPRAGEEGLHPDHHFALADPLELVERVYTLATTLPWLTPSSWWRGSTPWPPLCPGWPPLAGGEGLHPDHHFALADPLELVEERLGNKLESFHSVFISLKMNMINFIRTSLLGSNT